jgi:hypothetical protein
MIKYNEYKLVTEETPIEEANANRAYNNSILREGVVIDGKAVECLDNREPTGGERLDYERFSPWGSMLTWVEIYANGAKNLFVRNKLSGKVIGVITIRPMKPYNAEKEYKPLTF